MAKIPKVLKTHIDTAFPANVCLLGSVLPNGFAQVTPRGGTMVFDDEHIGLWERGSGSCAGTARPHTCARRRRPAGSPGCRSSTPPA